MSFDIKNFISPENLEVLRRDGHKVAAALRGMNEITMHSAVKDIGTRMFLKNAEARRVADGIEAFAQLRGEKAAGIWESLLSRSLAPAVGGAALMALPEYMKEGPTDQDAVINKALMGGALGGLGGAAFNMHNALKANPQAAESLAATLARRPMGG